MITLTDLPSRLADRINVRGGIPVAPLRPVPGQCWTVDTWHNSAGYPYLREDGRDQPAHRVIYEAATGEDITGLDLDHVCRNVACSNPNHEEPVTHAENQRRLSQAQTSCRRASHDWTDPRNVRTRPNGRRYCAACYRQGPGGHAKKVTDEQVREIRARAAGGETQRSIADAYCVAQPLVSQIVNYRARTDVA